MTKTPVTRVAWRPPLWVKPLDQEPPHGMYARLAERNGFSSVRMFENLTGLKLRHVRFGHALDQLGAMVRCEEDEISAYQIRHRRRGLSVIAGEAVYRGDLMMVERRACPTCLMGSPHHRFWWDLRFVASCPTHKLLLMDKCSCGQKLSWTDASIVKCSACRDIKVTSLASQAASPRVVALDQWILARFGIVKNDKRMFGVEGLRLGPAVEVIERVGSLEVGGYRPRWQEISDFDLPVEEVRAIGFEVLAERKICDALDRAYQGFRLANPDGVASLTTMYGWFWPWFRYRGGEKFSPELASAVLGHAQQRIQISRLAVPSLRRSRDTITLVETAQMCRVRVGTVRKLLAGEGLIRSQKRKGSPVMVPYSVAQRMARDLAESLNLRSLTDVLGVGRTSLIKLVRGGRVPIWVRGGNKQKKRYIFRRSEVLAWMAALVGDAPRVSATPVGMVSIAEAPLLSNVAVNVLVDAIESKRIRVEATLERRPNFSGALVMLEAVKAYRLVIGADKAGDSIISYRTRLESRSRRFSGPTRGAD